MTLCNKTEQYVLFCFLRNLGSNVLECSCQLVMTLVAVVDKITSAMCQEPAAATGVQFHAASAPDYYTEANSTTFQCSKFSCLLST